jgi:purine-nucleoside phosphorylase
MSSAHFPSDESLVIPAKLQDFRPRFAIVLGSGLGSLAESCRVHFEIPYEEIPGLPVSRVPGHAGKYLAGEIAGCPVLLALGRVHFYEGHAAQRVATHVRLIASLKPELLVLTNAAGTLNQGFAPGGWMMLSDHLNLTGASPLSGGPNFFDMSDLYSARWRRRFRATATAQGLTLHEGVYACVPGPQYETPAEVRMLRTLGADAVGMSTVFEAIQAQALGLEVAAFSCLTNWAAGVSSEPLSHDEVMLTGRRAAEPMVKLLAAALPAGPA